MTAPATYSNMMYNACGIKGAVACPPRWSRVGGNNCPNCESNYGEAACSTNPGIYYTTYELDQRRKVEILKYKKNSAQLSKAQQYSMASRNALTRKKSWATQTQTYTDPNVDKLPEIKNAGVTVALKCNQPIIPCSLTSDCDVPGPVIPLCIDESVPLYNYKMQLSYPSGGKEGITGLPIVCGYEGFDGFEPTPTPTPTPTPSTPNSLTITPIEGTGTITTITFYLNSSGNVLDPQPTIPDLNGFTVYTFNYTTNSGSTNAGSVSVIPTNTFNVTYLIVGGGGGGATTTLAASDGGGGGGGAGGLATAQTLTLNGGDTYNITVGGGGVGTSSNANGTDSVVTIPIQSSPFPITAFGGGAGGKDDSPGANGGSGGGGGSNGGSSNVNGGTSTQTNGYGNNGGISQPNTGAASGGGGAGQPGANADQLGNGGNGGDGLPYTITGTNTYYAGGGGGSTPGGTQHNALGGQGGGGVGGDNTVDATNGMHGTGGGGGGSTAQNTPGNGGSGIVILQFPSYN